jgi:hypothetical protein
VTPRKHTASPVEGEPQSTPEPTAEELDQRHNGTAGPQDSIASIAAGPPTGTATGGTISGTVVPWQSTATVPVPGGVAFVPGPALPEPKGEAADARTVVERLIDVMGDVGHIAKGRQVQEGPAKYWYRGIEDVQAALQGLLVRHRVLILPTVLQRIDHPQRTTQRGSAIYACALHVQFTCYGPAGDTVALSAWGEGADTGDKASGKAHSMAYKTAMLEAFCIPTEGDTIDGDRTAPEVTFSEEQRTRAGNAWTAAMACTTEAGLSEVRSRAQALLDVPVDVEGTSVPLEEALRGRLGYIRQRSTGGPS